VRRLALLIVVFGLVAAGCATVSGQPVASPTAAASDRPRDIRLDAIDPCSLFTPAVRQQVGINQPLDSDKSSDPIYRGQVPSCFTRGEGGQWFTVAVDFALQDGAEMYKPENVRGTVTPKKVHGYPALVVKQSKTTDECAVIVDVASGQLVDVTYRDGGNKPPIPQEELCVRAERVADLTIGELLRHP